MTISRLDTSRDVSRIGDKDLRRQISSGQYDTVSARDFQRLSRYTEDLERQLKDIGPTCPSKVYKKTAFFQQSKTKEYP
ncbi:hypothetical protein E2320_015426 [Naja naja]|nr:hypothetical protein E2320_015426 [Naja naja]